MTAALWAALDRYLAGEIALDELVSAVRGSRTLEREVGSGDAAALRAVAATKGEAGARAAAALARAVYERHRPGRLARDRAARLASGMLDGTIDVAAGTRALAAARAAGEGWIPEAFTALAAALDARVEGDEARGLPGLPLRLAAARARAAANRAPALVAARRLLEAVGDG